MKPKILVVDDERLIRYSLREALHDWGYIPLEAGSASAALAVFETDHPDAVLLDISLPDKSGLNVLAEIRQRRTQTVVLIITGHLHIENALAAWHGAADDFIPKPIDLPYLKDALHKYLMERRSPAVERRRAPREPVETVYPEDIIGESPAKELMIEFLKQAAASNASVLLQGESGTGKELLAKAIHFASPRAKEPFIGANLGALNSNLLSSQLFGHEKGAFTDAIARRIGYFERSHRGTLLLDEIAELPFEVQVMLLRVLEERRFERLGGEEFIKADVRIIAATNQDLTEKIATGRFREDLYYRLSVLPFHLPPLRERGQDVLLLADHFLRAERSRSVHGFTPEARAALMKHSWPGNVRELRNVIIRALALEKSDQITTSSLVFDRTLARTAQAAGASQGFTVQADGTLIPEGRKFDDLSPSMQRELIDLAKTLTNDKKLDMAELLKLSRSQLYRRLNPEGKERRSVKTEE